MIFRRSKNERERARIEERELARRMREESEPVVSVVNRNPGLDHESLAREREYQARRVALDQAERRQPVSLPILERPLCERHNWRPASPFPGAPRPPRSECPGCLAEHDTRMGRNAEREFVREQSLYEIKSDPFVNRTVPYLSPRQQELFDRAQEVRGGVLPGSDEERDAVDFLDGRRIDVTREDHARRSRADIAYESPWDESRVVYRKPSRRRPKPTWSQIQGHRFVFETPLELPEEELPE